MLRHIATALLLIATLRAQDRIPVMVELFTSEGCSSCPPADALLAELDSKQPVSNVDLIVLSEHVDYWNSLGWKDPFSASLFSERQQSYAQMLRSTDVYTPQAVIDGHYAVVGSNRANVLKAIAESSQAAKTQLPVDIIRQGNSLQVNLAAAAKGDVWVALTEAHRVSHVEHGENGGRTLQHVGVVRSLTKLSPGSGQFAQGRIQIDSNWGSEIRVVVFVQDRHSGRIIQAVQKKV